MLAIKNKHGLWYSGDQTYDKTPVFLVSPEYRNTYRSIEEVDTAIDRLKKKGMKNLKSVTVYKRSKK